MKLLRFAGNAKADLSAFPARARTRAGHELFMVQAGREPGDWKPMPAVGAGAAEIRVRDETGACRPNSAAAPGVGWNDWLCVTLPSGVPA